MSTGFTIADALAWTGAELLRGRAEQRVAAVSIDSRDALSGALFVAIRGEHHDGHDYLACAVRGGAAALMIEHGEAPPGECAVLKVEDTTRALGALAAGHRANFDGPLVAVTGSNGKTSTKDICASILGCMTPTHKTPGNLNNFYGLPLSLLARGAEHRALVVELGMNQRGEIAALAALARPTVGVITNVGSAHIGFLGSREAIAQEKGDLVAALDESGTAVLNAADPLTAAQAARSKARVLFFDAGAGDANADDAGADGTAHATANANAGAGKARAPRADFRAREVQAEGDGFAFCMETPQGEVQVRVAGIGLHSVANALAAAAAASAAGAGLDHIREGLAAYRPPKGRMNPHTLEDGIRLVDDTYNANPESLHAALRSLTDKWSAALGVAVLGDMGELGACTDAAHRAAGALAAQLGCAGLVALGEHAAQTLDAARAAGLDPARAVLAHDHEEAARKARALCPARGWILVKGSRAAGMENTVAALSREGGRAPQRT